MLQLGPDKTGLFRLVQVRTIHHKRVEVEIAETG
jgi:GTPase